MDLFNSGKETLSHIKTAQRLTGTHGDDLNTKKCKSIQTHKIKRTTNQKANNNKYY